MRDSLRHIFRVCGSLALAACEVYPQINTATLTGTVTDASHAVVAASNVELRNQATGVIKTTTATAGEFTFTFLPIGTYSVSVTASGFRKYDRTGLVLEAGQVLHLELPLEVGSVNETVTVSGETPLLQTESSSQLSTLTNTDVRELPQSKLDWTTLANLGNGMHFLSSSGAAGGTGTISMNGITGEAMSITVDGTNASSDPEVPATGIYQQPNVINTLNTDAIAEISVNKGIMPASVGGTMAGNVNIISKSGTNSFHGDAYEINSVSAENARNQFLTYRPRSTFNEYGGSVGGPIKRDRLFFLASYEGVRSSRFAALSGNVPSPYIESISPAIYSSVFALFPKVSQPASNPTALSVPYVGVGSQVQHDSHTAERIDYYLTPTNQLSVRYTRQDTYQLTPRIIASNPQMFKPRDDMYNASFIHSSPTGTWVSSTRFGYNRLYMLRVDEAFSSGLEGVGLSPWSSGGCEYYVLHGSTATYIEEISYTHGPHSIKFGGILQRLGTGRIDYNTASLSYSTLSDFLANIPSNVQITFDVPDSNLSTFQYGGYVQDDWKVRPNLTLNLGIRYDYFSVPRERDGRLFNRGVDPTRPWLGPGFGPYLPPSSIYNGDYNNFQPRIGLAWSLGAHHETVIRLGSGIFVNPIPMFVAPVVMMQAGPNIPFRGIYNRAQAVAGGLGYPIPNSEYRSIIPNLQSLGVLSNNVAVSYPMSQNYPDAYTIQWMGEIEREISKGLLVSVGYVANRAMKLSMYLYPNLPDRTTGIAPDPTYASFVLTEPIDNASYESMQAHIEKRFSKGLSFQGSYTLADSRSFCGANLVGRCAPQNMNNIRADLGPSPYDIRHWFNASFVYEPAIQDWMGLHGHLARNVLGGWQLSGILTAATGLPVNVRSAGSYPADRPDLVNSVNPLFGNYTSTLQYLNPAAFAAIPIIAASGAQARPGDLSRNAFYGPGMWNLDSSLAKSIFIGEKVRVKLRGDFFNTLNHTNLSGLVTTITATNFGKLTSATARSLQVGARLDF